MTVSSYLNLKIRVKKHAEKNSKVLKTDCFVC